MKKTTKGKEAQRLLNNRVFKEAFSQIELNLKEKWANTLAEHKDAREIIYMQLKALYSVRKQLELYVNEGKIEENRNE